MYGELQQDNLSDLSSFCERWEPIFPSHFQLPWRQWFPQKLLPWDQVFCSSKKSVGGLVCSTHNNTDWFRASKYFKKWAWMWMDTLPYLTKTRSLQPLTLSLSCQLCSPWISQHSQNFENKDITKQPERQNIFFYPLAPKLLCYEFSSPFPTFKSNKEREKKTRNVKRWNGGAIKNIII
jgi:hypothetical protein